MNGSLRTALLHATLLPTLVAAAPGPFVLAAAGLRDGPWHARHAAAFGGHAPGFNTRVLEAVDRVQARAMDGGGYFTGVKAQPPESPVGYRLELFGRPLLEPPRSSSYCSGASYAALVEALNLAFPGQAARLGPERLESLRMQERDGRRREDQVQFWGKWNDDGFGCHFALVQYAGMGVEVQPRDARPGDFMNISWTGGGGHSVVFLAWVRDAAGRRHLLYWSSQARTRGYGDDLVPLERIKAVKVVRVTRPEAVFSFDPATPVRRDIPGDLVDW